MFLGQVAVFACWLSPGRKRTAGLSELSHQKQLLAAAGSDVDAGGVRNPEPAHVWAPTRRGVAVLSSVGKVTFKM